MNRPLRICSVSGSRADYGLLVAPLRAMRDDPAFDLRLVLTGQHLVKSAGDTAAQARRDGFTIAAEVDMKFGGDDAPAVTGAAGRLLGEMGNVFARLAPDLVLLLGDRYEIVCCAIAATIARVPIVHIAGGDVTEGAFDDAFRHAITKMAHLHFVTNEASARRVRQLGEAADRIHVVGSPGLDLIRTTPVPSREAFFGSVGLTPGKLNILATFHPVTLAADSVAQLDEMLAALAARAEATILFTGANADPDGRRIDERVGAFVARCASARLVPSLGPDGYFAALTYMDVVVGNSSSGLYEAPSFGIPTVNVGDRQTGRLRAESVFDCPPQRDAVDAAITRGLGRGRKPTANPYGDGHAAERIIAVLKALDDPHALLSKRFAELAVA